MDKITEKYRDLLKNCMEKQISLDTIQQIIALRDMKNPEKNVETLLSKIEGMNEEELKKEIERIINQK